MKEKIVGVLGGMGPEATIDFMKRVIQLTPARDDGDHIRMIVDNNPKVPSRIKALLENSGDDPAPYLIEMAMGLEKLGADFLVIPCNTAHYYLDQIKNAVSIPVLNMVELTIEKILHQLPEIKTIGFLGSTAVIKIGLYENVCRKNHLSLLYPDPDLQQGVLKSIQDIKAGVIGDEQAELVQKAVNHLGGAGATAIIVGCTEISVIADRIQFPVQMVDASQVLAETVVYIVKENRLWRKHGEYQSSHI